MARRCGIRDRAIMADDSGAAEAIAGQLAQLSKREREVIRLVALGYTAKQVASELSVSVKTIETYRARIRDKLGLRAKVDVVRFAIDSGLLEK